MKRTALILAIVIAGGAGRGQAQYYDPREHTPSTDRFLYAGAVLRDFSPRGSNSLEGLLAIRFNRWMPVIGFHQGMVDVMAGYTTYTHLGVSRSTVFFGSTVTNDFRLAGSRPSALFVPLFLSVDFTKAEAGSIRRDDFNVGSLGLGAGVKYRYDGGTIGFEVQGGGIAHYSIEGFSGGSGFSAAILAHATLLVRTVPLLDGIAVSYHFRLQTWSMNNAVFDYRSLFHGLTMGVIF